MNPRRPRHGDPHRAPRQLGVGGRRVDTMRHGTQRVRATAVAGGTAARRALPGCRGEAATRGRAQGLRCAPVRALPPWPDGPGKDRVRRGGTPRRPPPPPFVLHGPRWAAARRSSTVAALGSRARPTPALSMAAAPANWSVENGSTSIGTPQLSASVTLLLPPWVTARCRSAQQRTCGRYSRPASPPAARRAPAGRRTRWPTPPAHRGGRRAATTVASTSPRTDRKLPKLTYTTGRSIGGVQPRGRRRRSAARRGRRNRGTRAGAAVAVRAGSCKRRRVVEQQHVAVLRRTRPATGVELRGKARAARRSTSAVKASRTSHAPLVQGGERLPAGLERPRPGRRIAVDLVADRKGGRDGRAPRPHAARRRPRNAEPRR